MSRRRSWPAGTSGDGSGSGVAAETAAAPGATPPLNFPL